MGVQSDSEPDPFAALITVLRHARLDPDAESLADALWLAGHLTTHPDTTTPVPDTHASPRAMPLPQSTDGREQAPDPGSISTRQSTPADGYSIHPVPAEYSGPNAPARGRIVDVPLAPVLPSASTLHRALRPLQRYRTAGSRPRLVLDEPATAECSASVGLFLPAFRESPYRDADLQLVVDCSPSMRVWDSLGAELEEIFVRIGAFHDVRVHYLHQGPDGHPRVSRSPRPNTGILHSARHLAATDARRLTCVVSDCTGHLWRAGHVHRMLHLLAATGPVAVIQPLPQRMWRRSALPVATGRLSLGQDGRVRLASHHPAPVPGALPVPVLPPQRHALGAWARLLSGTGTGTVPGTAAWVRHDQPPAPPPSAMRPAGPLERVSRFRATASPTAGRLAEYLAAAPLHLPVMRLVQRAMLPSSGPAELAEVLLGGIVTREDGMLPSEEPRFAMDHEVRQALLASLSRDEALLVLKHCSRYVNRRLGRGGANFPALAIAQIEDPSTARTPWDATTAGTDPQARPFARVAADVLRRFLPDAVPEAGGSTARTLGTARSHVADYEANASVPSLLQAVRLLRDATDRPDADPALDAAYATALLRLWYVHGDPAILEEAADHARVSADRSPAGDGPAALAAVLRVQADEAVRNHTAALALTLLAQADNAYATACSTAADTDSLCRLTLDRAQALETRWRLAGDLTALHNGIGMLEAVTDTNHPPPDIALAHGRLLRHLATATDDSAEALGHAARSVRSLSAAVAATPDPPPALVLELADAQLAAGPDHHEDLHVLLSRLLPTADGPHRARLLVRSGHLHLARHHETGQTEHLTSAVDHLASALDGLSHGSREHTAVLDTLGATLLCLTPTTLRNTDRAVATLRAGLRATTDHDPALPDRRTLLGRALMTRYRLTDDRIDLREAEHQLGLAANAHANPYTRSTRLLEYGRARMAAAAGLQRPLRLDDAVKTFRAAARAAREALDTPALTDRRIPQAVTAAAQSFHLMGTAHEAALRPHAAHDAYTKAADEWSRLPTGMKVTGEPAPRDTARRLAALNATIDPPTITGDP